MDANLAKEVLSGASYRVVLSGKNSFGTVLKNVTLTLTSNKVSTSGVKIEGFYEKSTATAAIALAGTFSPTASDCGKLIDLEAAHADHLAAVAVRHVDVLHGHVHDAAQPGAAGEGLLDGVED